MALAGPGFWISRTPPTEEILPPPPPKISQPPTKPAPPESETTLPIDDWAPPNRLPMPDPLEWQAELAWWHGVMQWAPAFLLGLWLFWFFWGHIVFNKEPLDGARLLNRFRLNTRREGVFGGPHTDQTLARLKASRWEPTRRLDIDATVMATAHRAGYLTPHFRQRRAKPRYLLLIQGQHRDDHGAALGAELYRRFEEAGLDVTAYRFRDQPELLLPWDDQHRAPVSLASLAEERDETRLVIISEFHVLFHPLSGVVRPWIKAFRSWPHRAWLNPGGADAPVAEWLWSEGFLLLPLDRERLNALVQWLSAGNVPQDAIATGLPWVPPTLATDARIWLHPHPPPDGSVRTVVEELTAFLGPRGFLLLQAVVVYPQPHWNLTQALDFLLFPEDRAEDREPRLRKLAWLPWLRHAFIPDYLRKILIERLSRSERRRVRNVYGELFARLSSGGSRQGLELAIARPADRSWSRLLRDLFRWRKGPGGLDDPVCASLLLGRTRAFLEFTIPRAIKRLLSGLPWRVEPRIVWLALALSAAGLGAWGAEAAWRRWLEPGIKAHWAAQTRAANAHWAVQLQASPETTLMAVALRDELRQQGFRDVAVVTANGEGKADSALPAGAGKLSFPPGAEGAARRLRKIARHVGYGQGLGTLTDATLPSDRLVLTLGRSHQAGATFNDTLANLQPGERPAAFSVFRDPLQTRSPAPAPQGGSQGLKCAETAGPADTAASGDKVTSRNESLGDLGPAMIALPGGRFTMGSPNTETDRSGNEGPPRAVTIRPFAIGRTEVSFDDYDRFARATGRPLPNDSGWGRGTRPVINVRWEDAVAYADWLSAQTGQAYRLPTEAEWEYAARAGTATPWFWGKDDTAAADHAWYFANSDGKTQETGRKRPNAFGLYDTAGNVWEWTADCWHENYTTAPVDGSAWLEANGGDCGRRVVRGGSWFYISRDLRSAYRDGITSDVPNWSRGFRVARAL
ncbi:MAG: SUMF1/EgtB/PvdO family nonheme iron enzyme [Methylococcus sp.]